MIMAQVSGCDQVEPPGVDRKRILIGIATLIVFLSIPALIALGIVTTFAVPDALRIDHLEGTAELRAGDRLIRTVSDGDGRGFRITPGQTLVLQPESEALLSFELLGASLSVRGPITLTLTEASRQATLPGHVFAQSDRFSRKYTIVLAVRNGRVQFEMDNAPRVPDVLITIHLPDQTFMPNTPCWRIDSSSSGQYLARSIDCPTP